MIGQIMAGLRYALKKLHDRKGSIEAVETGTIRNVNERNCYSTFLIAEYLAMRGGHLISIDSNLNSIATAMQICEPFRDKITWIKEDSLRILPFIYGVKDLFFIDSMNASIHCLQEFIYGMNFIANDGIIVVDNAGFNIFEDQLIMSETAFKGQKIGAMLHEAGIAFQLFKDDGSDQIVLELNEAKKEAVQKKLEDGKKFYPFMVLR